MKRIPMLAACVAFSAAANAQAPQGDPVRGKEAYLKNWCHTCHGTAGQGGDRGSGGRIAPNVFPWEGFVQQVRRPRDVMPRYPKEFTSDQDLADMHAYLMSIKPGKKATEIDLLNQN